MRIPHKILKQYEDITGVSNVVLCDYLATNPRRNMSKERAIQLENASKKLGHTFTASDWMFHPEKIRQELISQSKADAA